MRKNNIFSLKTNDDKEARRNARITVIISIIVIIWTVCGSLFKLAMFLMNNWSGIGLIYLAIEIFVISIIAMFIITIVNIIKYITIDLDRYNVKETNYKKNDENLDKQYYILLRDCKTSIMFLVAEMLDLCSLITIYDENSYLSKIEPVILIAMEIVMVGCILFINRKNLGDLMKYVSKLLLIMVFCAFLIYILVTNSSIKLNVYYGKNGIINIEQQSKEIFDKAEIKITEVDENKKDKKKVYRVKVKDEDVLLAKEKRIVDNGEKGLKQVRVKAINDDIVHWRYRFDIKKYIGKKVKDSYIFNVKVLIYQGNKKIKISNDFKVYDKNSYEYAKNTITKEY